MEQKAYEKSVYSIPEVAKILGISRNLAYQLAGRGGIPAIRLGKRLICPKAAIDQMLLQALDSADRQATEDLNVERS
jgi:excisionase family DNA binding protein